MDEATELLARVEANRERFRQMLARAGLTESSLEALAEAVRRRLPPAERQRVEDAARRLVPYERKRAGSSRRTVPAGIRG